MASNLLHFYLNYGRFYYDLLFGVNLNYFLCGPYKRGNRLLPLLKIDY